MTGKIRGVMPAVLIVSSLTAIPSVSFAADIVNKQLAACLAEKKPVGDVNSCGKRWKVGPSHAQVQADGTVNVQISGLVLDDASVGDANGTADGVDAIAVAIVCGGKVTAQAEPVPLTKEGGAKFTGKLAMPENCASPVVVVRERYEGKIGGWLAGTVQ